MKITRFVIAIILSVTVYSTSFSQGNLHVKGKIKADSLANSGYLIIIADSTGTLDTLSPGMAGQVLTAPLTKGAKPYWSTPISSSSFDPHFSDGTDSLIGVNEYLNTGQSYVVPNGKNFHFTHFDVEHNVTPTTYSLYVNGNMVWLGSIPMVLGPGTILSSNITSPDSSWIFGYLATPIVVPVIQELTGNPYTVPGGKTLYIIAVSPYIIGSNIRVFINGVKTATHDTVWSTNYRNTPILANAGDVVTTNNISSSAKVTIYGFLK